MAARIAWVLNLDADLELGAGAGYRPTKSVRLATKANAERLAAGLLGPNDRIVDETTPALAASGLPGRAFCPTPSALRILRCTGALPEPHPPVSVVRRVNSRAFASALGRTLPGAEFATDFAQAWTQIHSAPPLGAGWRVKYAFGVAGRNQRIVHPHSVGMADAAFVRAALVQGGVQIEPNVPVEQEYALHGVLSPDGHLRIGALVRQRCTLHGGWVATEAAASPEGSGRDVPRRLEEEVRGVAAALFNAGYFGPFGVDAYTYRDREGTLCLQPRSEINARYTMGFAVGFRCASRGTSLELARRSDSLQRESAGELGAKSDCGTNKDSGNLR